MFKSCIRTLATEAKFHVAQPPKYTLGSLRTFPSLEPHSFIPLPASFFDHPLRRDLLWSAVVFEADRARVGSGYVITKGDKLYSNKKLRPQKGSGKARVGDANSPIRDNEVKAHGIKAPHDWSTKLPNKIYARAFQTALAEKYRQGQLFIIGENENKSAADDGLIDFRYDNEYLTEQFVEKHDLNKLHLLFITDLARQNLLKSTECISEKADVLIKEAVEVRDLLKANRVYIEASALQWMIAKYTF